MLRRFTAMLDSTLTPDGVAILGHVERHVNGLVDLVTALRESFVVTKLEAAECAPLEVAERSSGGLSFGGLPGHTCSGACANAAPTRSAGSHRLLQ